MVGVNSLEYCVHYPGGQYNLSIRYRHGRTISDRAIEGLEKVLHARIHMKVHCEKKSRVVEEIYKILTCIKHWWNKVLCVTLKISPRKFDEYPLILIDYKTVL